MKYQIRINKLLLGLTMMVYFFIIIPGEKFDLCLFQWLIFSLLGITNVFDVLFLITGYAGIGILFGLQVYKKPVMPQQYKYLRLSILLLYIPLIVHHLYQPFAIGEYDYIIYIVPEIVFLILSVTIFILTFMDQKKEMTKN